MGLQRLPDSRAQTCAGTRQHHGGRPARCRRLHLDALVWAVPPEHRPARGWGRAAASVPEVGRPQQTPPEAACTPGAGGARRVQPARLLPPGPAPAHVGLLPGPAGGGRLGPALAHGEPQRGAAHGRGAAGAPGPGGLPAAQAPAPLHLAAAEAPPSEPAKHASDEAERPASRCSNCCARAARDGSRHFRGGFRATPRVAWLLNSAGDVSLSSLLLCSDRSAGLHRRPW
mmetsp:Transcript_14890/g.42735  ORF Transcript_14890/g.42735 Transcript_14890/m.42735 type:complete len:229 (+) Transcript_14890:1835-2521(+)